MAIKGLVGVKDNGKYFSIQDFKPVTKTSKSVFSKKSKLDLGVGLSLEGKILLNGIKIAKTFSANGKLFAFSLSGEIFVKVGESFNKIKIPPFLGIPKIFPIDYDGKKSALIISEGANYIINDSVHYVGVLKADTVASFKDGLFFGYKRKIYACLEKDHTLINPDFLKYKTINIPQKLSCVKKLIPFSDHLLAVCAGGFAEIRRVNDDLELSVTIIDADPLKIEEDTAIKIGESVYFISRGKFCVYQDKKVRVIDTLLDKNSFNKISAVGSSDNFYLLPGVTFDGEIGLLVYDTQNNLDTFIDFSEEFLTEDGRVLDKEGNLKKVTTNGDFACLWQSDSTDFNEQDKKTVYQVYIKCSGECKFTLIGDKKQKSFNLKEGGNLLNANVYASQFSFLIEGDKNAFPITELKVKYGI